MPSPPREFFGGVHHLSDSYTFCIWLLADCTEGSDARWRASDSKCDTSQMRLFPSQSDRSLIPSANAHLSHSSLERKPEVSDPRSPPFYLFSFHGAPLTFRPCAGIRLAVRVRLRRLQQSPWRAASLLGLSLLRASDLLEAWFSLLWAETGTVTPKEHRDTWLCFTSRPPQESRSRRDFRWLSDWCGYRQFENPFAQRAAFTKNVFQSIVVKCAVCATHPFPGHTQRGLIRFKAWR